MFAERYLTQDIIDRLETGQILVDIFIFADFPDNPQRIWTGTHDIEWDGHTWTGYGPILEIADIAETTDTGAAGITINLATANTDYAMQIMTSAWQNRRFEIYLALWDAARETFATVPNVLWAGYLDTDSITESRGSVSVQLSVEHEQSDILRKRNYRLTQQTQAWLYPNDVDDLLANIEAIQEKQMPWGRTNA